MKTKLDKIQMVDLKSQYERLKENIDSAIQDCISSSVFIKGPIVDAFQRKLEQFLFANHVITCANGTDALQIAIMSLNLKIGDEVIIPAFTYVATAEVVALLGLTPVLVDVNPDTFNIDIKSVEKAITEKTKLIIPVHLFGQCADMESIMAIAQKHSLYIIEDNAQAIGANYTFSDGNIKKAGTIGHIGTTSFFPSKNLGCYGDGGALFTNSEELAIRIRMISNHGQSKQYFHEVVGVNSRLDAIQAAILNVKLSYLESFNCQRLSVANQYDCAFEKIDALQIPVREINSTHVFHQYTLKVKNGNRDKLKNYLSENGIPTMIYYPLPLNKQNAFKNICKNTVSLEVSESLCKEVISLPIHSEFKNDQLDHITNHIKTYFEYV